MRKRISKLEQLMSMAEVAALRSHDAETQVGCVLIDSNTDMPLASACNGFARGVCDHRIPNTRPDKYQYIIHSEINMLASCAKQGISTKNKYLVCTMSPCSSCMRALYQAGIERVIVKDKYKDFETLKNMKDLKISESNTEEGFTQLTYTARLPKIVFIGSNPSNDSPDNSAFHPDTKSGRRVRSWTEGLKAEFFYLNVSDEKTLMNEPLTKKQIEYSVAGLYYKISQIEPDLIVSVGESAKFAIQYYQAIKYHMPHPSGLSRFWNSKEASELKVSELRDLISRV